MAAGTFHPSEHMGKLLREVEARPSALPALGPRDTSTSWKPLLEGPLEPLVRALLCQGLLVALQPLAITLCGLPTAGLAL